VEAKVYDAYGILCLDARNNVHFSLAGAGKLIDNLGTSRASRELQLYNGRAVISLQHNGLCTVGIDSEGLSTALLQLR
jgi:beta-galactosidase